MLLFYSVELIEEIQTKIKSDKYSYVPQII